MNSGQNNGCTHEPGDGKEFVVFYFEAENISSKDATIGMVDFSGNIDGTSTSVTSFDYEVPGGYSSLTGEIKAGENIKGYVALKPNKGWKELSIIYDIFNDGELTFSVVPGDISK